MNDHLTAEQESNLLRLTQDFWSIAEQVWRGVMTDAVFWVNDRGNARIAFIGNPLKVAQVFGMLDQKYEVSPYLGQQIERAITSVMRVHVDKHDWHESPGTIGEIFDRFSGQTVWSWAEINGDIGDEGVRVTFIPEPGWPWPAEGDRYWSAKKRAWQKSERPAWLIEVADREEPGKKVWGVNPCIIFPSDETKTEPDGPVYGDIGGMPLMLTHCTWLGQDMANHKQIDNAIAGIRDCGGFLFPSLAVGPIPATNFGPIVFVANLELLLDSLLPYRKHKRRRPCWVYSTDAWTVTTGTAMGDMATELFSELHGYDDWYGRYISTLGVQWATHGFGGWHEPITSTKRLASALKKRFRSWKRDLSEAAFEKLSSEGGHEKYAYTEAKAREVVSLAEFPFIVAPAHLKKEVDRFTRGLSYEGEVVFVQADDLEKADYEQRAIELYRWGWVVSDVVKELRRVVEVET